MHLVALVLLVAAAAPAGPATGSAMDAAALARAVDARDVEVIRKQGAGVVPGLVRLYDSSEAPRRAAIANVFYSLGWKSADAKRALLKDVHTDDANLRLQVQWALGRVSGDTDVVDVLLENMLNDPNPLFRDKAACALTYDQIHLSPADQVRVYEGLIRALDDPKPQVRQIALMALQIRTGQNKGFSPGAAPEERRKAVERWRAWLAEYKSNL